jgi:serine protease Do
LCFIFDEELDAYSRAVTTVVEAVEVFSVDPESPAGSAGMRMNDLIVSANGQKVANVDDLHRFLGEWPIGEPVTFTVVQGKNKTTLTVVPAEAGALP